MQISPRIHLYEGCLAPIAMAPGVIALPQIPSSAFGDGSHPTTRLCAGVVDFHCRTQRPERMLDVDTGTGVLARIARARGVGMVVGTDVDESALESARQNAALDSAGTNIFFLNAGPGSWGPSFGFVVANILAEVLLALAPELAAALSPGGALCLSGFTPLQAPALRVAYERLGLVASAESVLDGWAVLLLRKPPAVAATNHIS